MRLQKCDQCIVISLGDRDGLGSIVVQLGKRIATGIFPKQFHMVGIDIEGPVTTQQAMPKQHFLQGPHGGTKGEFLHASIVQMDDMHIVLLRLNI